MVTNLVFDCVNRGVFAGMRQDGWDFGGGGNGIYVVEGEGFFHGHGETGPDDGIGIDGRDVEGGFIGIDVVREVGIWELTSGEVEEVSSLSGAREVSKMLLNQSEMTSIKGASPSLSSIIFVFCPSK